MRYISRLNSSFIMVTLIGLFGATAQFLGSLGKITGLVSYKFTDSLLS